MSLEFSLYKLFYVTNIRFDACVDSKRLRHCVLYDDVPGSLGYWS